MMKSTAQNNVAPPTLKLFLVLCLAVFHFVLWMCDSAVQPISNEVLSALILESAPGKGKPLVEIEEF